MSRLPNPVAAEWDWQLLAACRGVDTQVFFSPEAERGARRLARERVAKAVCSTCPVLQTCREHAIRAAEPFGVWGGLTPDERRALALTMRSEDGRDGERRDEQRQPRRERSA